MEMLRVVRCCLGRDVDGARGSCVFQPGAELHAPCVARKPT